MKRLYLSILLLSVFILFTGAGDKKWNYPDSPKRPVVDDYFGTKIEDPYRWLENADSQEVEKWTEAENNLTGKTIESILQRKVILNELKAMWDYPKVSAPIPAGRYFFYNKNNGLQNQSVLFVKDIKTNKESILVDPNKLSKDGTVAMDYWMPSENGSYVAYGVSKSGDENSILHIRNVVTGKDLPDVIDGCRWASIAWKNDETGLYLTKFPIPGTVPKGDEYYFQKVYYHKLGGDPANDALILDYPEKKEVAFDITISHDDRYLAAFANLGSSRRVEVFIIDLSTGARRKFFEGFRNFYSGEFYQNRLYLQTDDGAENGRIMAIDLNDMNKLPSLIIPGTPDQIEGFGIVNHLIYVQYLHRATSKLTLFDKDGKYLKDIFLPAMGSILDTGSKWDKPVFFIRFSSFTYPPAIYKYDFKTGEIATYRKADIAVDSNSFVTRQVFYPSKDGKQISMFIVHKKGLKQNGKNPTYLTGYGGFTIPMTPYFSPTILWWLKKGGIYALPNLRGGNEYGEQWHKDGMLEHKQNVFDDFISAAEYLIKEKYTSPEYLGIIGGSNGGLLVGAVETQRPEIFKAVVCEVPLLDMLRYHLFSVARFWISEYGSSEDNSQFKYIYAYSPYHHVIKGTAYPATLLMAGASDTRVDALHARKMAALMQDANSSDNPILLRIEEKAGHGQGKPTSKRLEESSDIFAFLSWQLKLKVN